MIVFFRSSDGTPYGAVMDEQALLGLNPLADGTIQQRVGQAYSEW